ncbi:MAG TPA: DUF6134 family protein [Flavisolibacter sp.]|nr:DUF6134 family protein [Flavisolibacter sp.]
MGSFAQEQRLQYAINRNGKTVGNLSFRKSINGTRTTYNILSEVKVAVLMTFTVQAREQSVYDQDVLQSSSVVRQVNGKQKANKQVVNNGNGLTVSDDGQRKELKNYRVKYNSHCLYAVEPVHYTNVFSDNYQQFVPIVKVAEHHYRVSFPDGGSNDYFYENGVCKKVQVKSSMFDAEFVLLTL